MLARIASRVVDVVEPDTATIAPITPITRARRATSWMLARLQAETIAHHAPIESLLFDPLERPCLSSYRHFLARMYGFDAPLGTRLLSTPGLPADLVIPRIRSSWIAADLLALDLTRVEARMLVMRHDVPAFDTGAEALGWLYAWERLVLRHDLIRARLKAMMPSVLDVAGQYLASTAYGTRHAWVELGALIDRAAYCENVAGRIVQAAQAAFVSQRQWLEATAWDGF